MDTWEGGGENFISAENVREDFSEKTRSTWQIIIVRRRASSKF